jgi:hypothetical protein
MNKPLQEIQQENRKIIQTERYKRDNSWEEEEKKI